MNSPWVFTGIPLLLMLAMAATGMRVRLSLKDHHRSFETIDLLRVTVTMLVTFAAIVLGLLITSSKSSFDNANGSVHNYATALIELDDQLVAVGPPAALIRQQLSQYTAAAIASTWVGQPPPPGNYYPRNVGNDENGIEYQSAPLSQILQKINGEISQLPTQTPAQLEDQKSCAALMNTVFQRRWDAIEASQVSLSTPFFVVLVFWLLVVFLCLGLSTPFNALSAITIILSDIALSSALFVIADLNGLYDGTFTISSQPMRDALAQMLAGG